MMVLRPLLVASFIVASSAACAAGRDEAKHNPNPDRAWGRTVGGLFSSAKSIAIVIAISNYIGERAGGYRELPTARRDADKMEQFLLRDAGFDMVHVLTDDAVTKERIDQLMIDEIPRLVGPRDRFLFYWSGHGDQMTSGDETFGFLPLARSKSKEFSKMVSMDDIVRWDRYLSTRHALFVLDACLSGLAGYEKKSPRDARMLQLSEPAHYLLTAGTANEAAIAGERWTGSLFTDSFILGAKGEAPRAPSGIVSLFSLWDYIQERLIYEKLAINYSKSLTPQIRSLRAGDGTFFFTPILPVGTPPSAATPQIPEQKGPSEIEAQNRSVALADQAAKDVDNRNYDTAIAATSEAIRLYPENALAFNNRGAAYLGQGELDLAMADFNEAIRLSPKDALAFTNRGFGYMLLHDYDRAMADFNEAIRLDPEGANGFSWRGLIYEHRGDLDRAMADFNEAIRVNPKSTRAFIGRGRLYANKGYSDRAMADFNEAIRLDPKNGYTFCARGRAKLKFNQADGDEDMANARLLGDSTCR